MNNLKFAIRQLLKDPSFTAVAVLALAASIVARAEEETEHVDRTLAFPSGGTLQLHNFSGDVHITGTTGKDLVIKAVRRAERDRLDHIALDIQTSGSTVTIDANKRDPGWQHDKSKTWWRRLSISRCRLAQTLTWMSSAAISTSRASPVPSG